MKYLPPEIVRNIYSFLEPLEVRAHLLPNSFDERICNKCWDFSIVRPCCCEWKVPTPFHTRFPLDKEASQMVLFVGRQTNVSLPPVFPTLHLQYRNQWNDPHVLRWKFCRRHFPRAECCSAEWLDLPPRKLRELSSHFEIRRHQRWEGERCDQIVCPSHPVFIGCSVHPHIFSSVCEDCLVEILRGNRKVYLPCPGFTRKRKLSENERYWINESRIPPGEPWIRSFESSSETVVGVFPSTLQ